MKLHRVELNRNGLTLVELLVVAAVISFLVGVMFAFMARTDRGGRPNATICMNNQKQIAIGFVMWDNDNGDKFPWQVSETDHGAMEASARGDAAADFNLLQTYIKQPWIFICPTDLIKIAATNQTPIENQNLSYFVGIDGTTNAAIDILTGDRHLQANGAPVKPGLFTYTTNAVMNWTSELHSAFKPAGALSFYDGHCEMLRGVNLDSTFQRQNLATARYAVP
jgi:prepilin-type N-terminal cleavage/methylation domain-containing protein